MSVKVTVSDCRAGAEPRVFEGKSGSAVARFNIAHNARTEENGAIKEETRWFNAVAFGPAARFVQENVHKGTRLAVEGELHYGRPYMDKEGVSHTPDELHVIPGRGSIELLKAAAGARPDQSDEPMPAA